MRTTHFCVTVAIAAALWCMPVQSAAAAEAEPDVSARSYPDAAPTAGRPWLVVYRASEAPTPSLLWLSREPGQPTHFRAALPSPALPLHERWWFWTALAGIAATTAVTTFVFTRPRPEPPAPEGGALGWVVHVP